MTFLTDQLIGDWVWEDSWGKFYVNNTEYHYLEDYNKTAARNMTGLYNFTNFGEMQLLWPREISYLYVINSGDSPQEFTITYSRSTYL